MPVGKRFQPGQSGNPSGRPKDVLTAELRKQLTPEISKKLTDVVLRLAMAGDLKATELIWNRIEGKAIDRQERGEAGTFDQLAELGDGQLKSLLKAVESQDGSRTIKRAS